MPNRENVLAWLKICGEDWDCSESCPYHHVNETVGSLECMGALMCDAINVIEEETQHIWDLSVEKKQLRDKLKEQEEKIDGLNALLSLAHAAITHHGKKGKGCQE